MQLPWSDFQNNFQNAFLGIWTKMNNKHKLLLRFPLNKLGHKPTITFIRTLQCRWKPTRNGHRIYSTGILTVFSDFGKKILRRLPIIHDFKTPVCEFEPKTNKNILFSKWSLYPQCDNDCFLFVCQITSCWFNILGMQDCVRN